MAWVSSREGVSFIQEKRTQKMRLRTIQRAEDTARATGGLKGVFDDLLKELNQDEAEEVRKEDTSLWRTLQ